uniref:Virion structural protein n=1 Tax=Pseudomonas phage RVTF4 TaxID=3236931 RepID=A0AB39CCX8_9VIRU
MYTLFRDDPVGSKGVVLDPKRPQIQRNVARVMEDVTNYYRRHPKVVDARNLFSLIISHFVLEYRSDDAQWAKKCEDQAKLLIRNLGLTDAINRGKIFDKGVTLGPECEEVVISSIERFDTQGLRSRWRQLKPVRYLYHTRSDTNLPIMNNKTPGKGYGVIMINIPMLMVQYRHWVYNNFGAVDGDSVNHYKFIGAHVLVDSLESYLEIAYFNRLSRMAYKLPATKYPLPHPFYIPDYTNDIDAMAKRTIEQRVMFTGMITELAQSTPMIMKDNLWQVIQLPKGPVTIQNEWALALARIPYIKYLVDSVKKAPGYDKTQTNIVLRELQEAMHSQSLRMNGSSEMMKRLWDDVRKLVEELT